MVDIWEKLSGDQDDEIRDEEAYEPADDLEPEDMEVSDWPELAYDEDGNEVHCEHCDEETLVWNEAGYWECPNCGERVNRKEFLSLIGAQLPDARCVTCKSNYPACKEWCPYLDI